MKIKPFCSVKFLKAKGASKLYQCRSKNIHLSYCICIVCMLANVHKKHNQEKRNLSDLLVISKWSQGTITAALCS